MFTRKKQPLSTGLANWNKVGCDGLHRTVFKIDIKSKLPKTSNENDQAEWKVASMQTHGLTSRIQLNNKSKRTFNYRDMVQNGCRLKLSQFSVARDLNAGLKDSRAPNYDGNLDYMVRAGYLELGLETAYELIGVPLVFIDPGRNPIGTVNVLVIRSIDKDDDGNFHIHSESKIFTISNDQKSLVEHREVKADCNIPSLKVKESAEYKLAASTWADDVKPLREENRKDSSLKKQEFIRARTRGHPRLVVNKILGCLDALGLKRTPIIIGGDGDFAPGGNGARCSNYKKVYDELKKHFAFFYISEHRSSKTCSKCGNELTKVTEFGGTRHWKCAKCLVKVNIPRILNKDISATFNFHKRLVHLLLTGKPPGHLSVASTKIEE